MKTSLNRERVAYIVKNGKRYTQDGVTIVCVRKGEKTDAGRQKYAILIPKKVVKNSVARNRMRRILRETVKKTAIQCSEFVILHNSKHNTEEAVRKALTHIAQKI